MTNERKHVPPVHPGSRASTIEQAALDAARQLLADAGVKGLTIEGVSARTGIAKTTLYRRWRSKEDLALAVVLDMARTAVAAPVHDDIRQALISYLAAATTILRTTLMGRVMQGLASDLATDPDMANAFRTEVVTLRHTRLTELVRRGVDTGQLRTDVDVAILQDLLFGPIYYRLLFSGTPLEEDLAERIVDAVLPSIAAHPTPRA
ncbi:MAG: TetR/AcrR family transcriptional regulator [Nocardioides sp.]